MESTNNTNRPVSPQGAQSPRPFSPRPFGNRPPRPFQRAGAPAGSGSFAPRPAGSFDPRNRSKNPRKGPMSRDPRVKPEFEQKILNIRRVTRVTSGGKRLNFSVVVVAGNKKGSVGVGMGKANDTSIAIEKAFRDARKNMLNLKLTKTMSIPHEVMAKYCSGKVLIMPAAGRGVTAGSAVRSIVELAGIKDVTTKILSPSKNKLNIAMAAIEALKMFTNKKPVEVKVVEKKEEVVEVK